MIEWNLRSRSRLCHKCGGEFIDGGKCRSAVLHFAEPLAREIFAEKIAAQAAEREKDGKDASKDKAPEYVRIDFCEPCWNALASAPPPPPLWISAWQSLYAAPEPDAPEPLPKETVETLLRKFVEGGSVDENASVTFVLAVMLERKKLLIERGVRRGADGRLVRIYEHRKTGEIMLITDPDLGIEEIPGVQQQIDLLLNPPEEPVEEAAEKPAGADSE